MKLAFKGVRVLGVVLGSFHVVAVNLTMIALNSSGFSRSPGASWVSPPALEQSHLAARRGDVPPNGTEKQKRYYARDLASFRLCTRRVVAEDRFGRPIHKAEYRGHLRRGSAFPRQWEEANDPSYRPR
jgi:hypothetical protein